ncbi:MAG: 50S ribosomal protein L29 [Nannocystaceae bacterium]
MKASELRDKSNEDLLQLEKDLRDQLIRMRVSQATSRRVSTAMFSSVRRDIARIKTILTQREGATAGEAQ